VAAEELTFAAGKLECSPSSMCAAANLLWKSGQISGLGTFAVTESAKFSEPTGTKMLSGALLSLQGNATAESGLCFHS
jgi:hypothetical protein